ncbi:SMI1/KNR4 family protein [Kitasatospora sp. SolWspMP-SS2h]|uniref:SMI1/KNR4 family protein n=1 Tax=Kitasatospora sp. SolWspMP-SS2h TaxID=1305729 RepID=UPI001313F2C5|nr:SMI1/KNR4 family protein [Kitasatospora sp. SolWspMP-SS2h]
MENNNVNDGFERLARILGDPPVPPRQVDWESAPEGARIPYPSDYRKMVEVYGGGYFAGGLSIYTPLYSESNSGPTGFDHLIASNWEVADLMEQWYGWYPGDRPYEPYPAPNGLFAWANDCSANEFLWDTSGPDPEQWPIVMWNVHEEGFVALGSGMADFLASLLDRTHPLSDELIDFDSGGRLWSPPGGDL